MQKFEPGYFAGPSSYDRCLGPLLFEPYATHMAERISDLREGRSWKLLRAPASRHMPWIARCRRAFGLLPGTWFPG